MESSEERTAKWRAMITNHDKKMIREKDRADKAKKRAMMTEEEKQKMREKDRIRKASKYVSLKKGKTPSVPYIKNEREHNRKYTRQQKKLYDFEMEAFSSTSNISDKSLSNF